MSDNNGGSMGCVFMAFIMGAAIGGGLALLTAPRSGKETRDRIRDMADDARSKVQDAAREAEVRIKEAIDEGKEALIERRDMVKSAIEAGKEAMAAEKAKHQPAEPA